MTFVFLVTSGNLLEKRLGLGIGRSARPKIKQGGWKSSKRGKLKAKGRNTFTGQAMGFGGRPLRGGKDRV